MARKYTMSNGATAYAQNGSTEFAYAGSTGDLMFAALYKGNSTASTDLMITTTGGVYSNSAPINYAETLALSSGGFDVSTATPYGVTYIGANATGGDFSTSPRLLTLGNPIAGVPKSILFASTAAAINTIDIDLGAANTVVTTTGITARYIALSSLASAPQAVHMVGLSSVLWGVLSVESTLFNFGVASGIRGATAVRTS